MTSSVATKLMLYGFIVAEQLFITVCFYRFWRASRERLFAWFAAGFLVMALHRLLLGFTLVDAIGLEAQTPVFLIRLLSYMLILAGVVAKNIESRGRRSKL
jgi:hypothetical protein